MTEQKTIIPETIGQKIVKGLKNKSKERKLIIAISILAIILVAGYATGYISGYHQALIDFNIIQGRVIVL
jgi:ABC-type dipeptide/oligopeptide/nickel transport system permease subunit